MQPVDFTPWCPTDVTAAVVDQARGGVGKNLGGRNWNEWRTIWHCEVLDWMGEWVGGAASDYTGRLGGVDSRLSDIRYVCYGGSLLAYSQNLLRIFRTCVG